MIHVGFEPTTLRIIRINISYYYIHRNDFTMKISQCKIRENLTIVKVLPVLKMLPK